MKQSRARFCDAKFNVEQTQLNADVRNEADFHPLSLSLSRGSIPPNKI